jgi:hypothetical protein
MVAGARCLGGLPKEDWVFLKSRRMATSTDARAELGVFEKN